MSAAPGITMINCIMEGLKAKPFVPFALTLVTNERLPVPTKEHLSLPPLDEADRRPSFVVIYNLRTSLPRYLKLESVISIDHEL